MASPKSKDSVESKRSVGSTRVTILGIFSFIVLATSLIYKNKLDRDALRNRLDQTLDSMLKIEEGISVNTNAKIAVGYGSCVDIVVNAVDVLQDYEWIPSDNGLDDMGDGFSPSISSINELLDSFGRYFAAGAAAERFVSNKTLFRELISKAKSVAGVRETLGGNAPVMASRFFREGVKDVILGSRETEDLKKLLPNEITVTGGQSTEADTHILLEFPAGEIFNGLQAPRANRFIIHSDTDNAIIGSMEGFHESILSNNNKNIDLLVVSGLQMLDNFPSQEKHKRIDKVSSFLQDLKMNQPQTRIHFEFASFTEESLVSQVVNGLLPHVDSLGMNEQELDNLNNIFSVGNISLLSNPYPRTAVVLDQMRNVFLYLDSLSSSLISRIHVHTLAFQAILVRKDSQWKESRAAAVKAALTAHRHTCGNDIIDVDAAKLIMDDSFSTSSSGKERIRIQFEPSYPVPCWEESIASNGVAVICVAPVLVCTRVSQTGGGGDNVSAAGLVAQI